jgi:glycolate oxidase subunit GlcD
MRKNSQNNRANLISKVKQLVGTENVLLAGAEKFEEYCKDMAGYEAIPLMVAQPQNEQQVAVIVKLASQHLTPIVARGAGSSLVGAVVSAGGIILDMQRLNKIIKVDTVNWVAHVQCNVVLDDLNDVLDKLGFFFPPDPASSFIATVGGAINTGAGGFRSVKYGTMRDWVLALRVVLSNGSIVNLGEPLLKNRAGYNLSHLLVGSEGTLGIVVEAWLRIIPKPNTKVHHLLALFSSWEDAGKAIRKIRAQKMIPRLLEFMDREALTGARRELNSKIPVAECALLIDVEETEGTDAKSISNLLLASGSSKVIVARSTAQAEDFLRARALFRLVVNSLSPNALTEDVVVPIDRLVEYLTFLKELSSKYSVKIPVAGHAGDGNVHPHILYDANDPASKKRAERIFEEICRYAIKVGGSVTGEHGVGAQKIRYFREQLAQHGGEEVLPLMRKIKQVFDPKGILNPGKYVDREARSLSPVGSTAPHRSTS